MPITRSHRVRRNCISMACNPGDESSTLRFVVGQHVRCSQILEEISSSLSANRKLCSVGCQFWCQFVLGFRAVCCILVQWTG
jgi:hypothetical protein